MVATPQIRNFILKNEVPDLGHGRVGCWVPCLDEVVGFVFGFTFLGLYVGGRVGVVFNSRSVPELVPSRLHPIHCSI